MPNWTMISVRFDGNENEINNMLEFIKGEDGVFDFNKVIPMPKSLEISEGSEADRAMKCYEAERVGKRDRELIKNQYHITDQEFQRYKELGKIYSDNEKKYGYRSWYGWCNANWNTKWNACDASYTNGVLYFETAWNFPTPVMKKLSEMYPDITMMFEVEDEGYDGVDRFSLKNGERTEE